MNTHKMCIPTDDVTSMGMQFRDLQELVHKYGDSNEIAEADQLINDWKTFGEIGSVKYGKTYDFHGNSYLIGDCITSIMRSRRSLNERISAKITSLNNN